MSQTITLEQVDGQPQEDVETEEISEQVEGATSESDDENGDESQIPAHMRTNQTKMSKARPTTHARSVPKKKPGREHSRKSHGGKGLGKGRGKAFFGKRPIRHRKPILRDNIQGITKPAIRRLMRRAGVKRVGDSTYEIARESLKVFLTGVIGDAVKYTTHAKKKTVTTEAVVLALKRRGHNIYGFGK